MSRFANDKRRHLQFQNLEQRVLLAADLKASAVAPAASSGKEITVQVSKPVATATSVELDVAKVVPVDMFDQAKYEKVFEEIGPEKPVLDHGLGLDGQVISYDTIEGMDNEIGPVGGNPGDEGFGPQGHQSSLDGANAQDKHEDQRHDAVPLGPKAAADNRLAPYKEGGLETSDKTPFQMEHACLALDGDAYKLKDNGTDGGTDGGTTGTGGNLMDSSPDHTAKKEDDSKDTQPAAGGGGDAEDDAAEEDSSGDGDAPPEEPEAAAPDYGEGYVDPDDPINQVWAEFTNAYHWANFEADQGSDVDPNPNSDAPGQVEYAPVDAKSWVDGFTVSVPTEVTDPTRGDDGGDIDPVEY